MEGPCVDSLRTVSTLAVEHLRYDHRWPRYVPAAVGHGVLSQLAFRLHADDDTFGCISFYGTESETMQSGAMEIAELFAAQATIALARAIEKDTPAPP
jgi:GAF domain-containing protein